jgi:stage IV sporulation protein FB
MTPPAPRPLFSLFGVPVRVEPWFFIIPAFALQTRDLVGALIWTALVFTGVLAHEFGHALAMKRFGLQPSIQLHAMGGYTHYPPRADPTPRESFFITLAGPGVGLVLGLVAYAAQQLVTVPSAELATALADAVWINLGWSFVNLLPVLPWDGGHLLEAGLVWRTGRRHDRVVAASSALVGGAIIAYALASQSLLFGYFGAMGLMEGWKRWQRASG